MKKGKGLDGGSSDSVKGDRSSFRPEGTVANSSPSVFSKDDIVDGRNSNNGLVVKRAVSFETLIKDLISNLSVGDSLNEWDKADGAACGLQVGQEAQLEENETNISLAGGLSKPWEDAMSIDTFKNVGPCSEGPEMSSPIKAINETHKECHPSGMGLSLEAENEPIIRGKWKKIAREKGKAQEEDMGLKGPNVGNKRRECLEDLLEAEGRVQKKVRRGESCNNSSDFLNKMAVTAKQHCQEK